MHARSSGAKKDQKNRPAAGVSSPRAIRRKARPLHSFRRFIRTKSGGVGKAISACKFLSFFFFFPWRRLTLAGDALLVARGRNEGRKGEKGFFPFGRGGKEGPSAAATNEARARKKTQEERRGEGGGRRGRSQTGACCLCEERGIEQQVLTRWDWEGGPRTTVMSLQVLGKVMPSGKINFARLLAIFCGLLVGLLSPVFSYSCRAISCHLLSAAPGLGNNLMFDPFLPIGTIALIIPFVPPPVHISSCC